MSSEQEQYILQFVIAVIVLVGGGLLMAFFPSLSDKIFPVMTLAAGFYFSQSANKAGATTALQTLSVQSQTANASGSLNTSAVATRGTPNVGTNDLPISSPEQKP